MRLFKQGHILAMENLVKYNKTVIQQTLTFDNEGEIIAFTNYLKGLSHSSLIVLDITTDTDKLIELANKEMERVLGHGRF